MLCHQGLEPSITWPSIDSFRPAATRLQTTSSHQIRFVQLAAALQLGTDALHLP